VQARTLASLWSALADVAFDLHVGGTDVIIDAGRLGHREEPTALLSDADVLALVLSPTVPSTVATSAALRRLAEARAPRSAPVVVVIGARRPYTAREVERALGCPVQVVAFDAPVAESLNAGDAPGARLDRSTLMRSVRGLAVNLLADVPTGVL
jgi:Flp pilus assembly CpaE family ATPase